MGRRLRESMVRGRRKKVDDVLTTFKRHCESDCVLEGARFVGTCKDAARAFTLCGRLGS